MKWKPNYVAHLPTFSLNSVSVPQTSLTCILKTGAFFLPKRNDSNMVFSVSFHLSVRVVSCSWERLSLGHQGQQKTGSKERDGPHGWESPGWWERRIERRSQPYLLSCGDEAESEGTVRGSVMVSVRPAMAPVSLRCSMISRLPQGLACAFSISLSAGS